MRKPLVVSISLLTVFFLACFSAHGRLVPGDANTLPRMVTSHGTYKLGKKPYPAGTREQWIAEGRVLAKAPEGYIRRPRTLKGSADNRSILPPIGNQGSEGSCVHWAGAYYTKTANMKRQDPTLNVTKTSNQCSPRFTYNLTNAGEDNGGWGHEPFEIFMRYGGASLAQKPYVAGQYATLPVVADFVEGLHRRTADYVWVWQWGPTTEQINELKAWLDAGGVAACAVYAEDTFDAWSPGDAPWVGTACTEANINHMVTVCGYGPGYYLVANSWGTSFGSNGFIVVDSSYFEKYFSDVMYPIEGTYEPAPRYAKVSITHGRRSDIRSLTFAVNGSTVWSNAPTPKSGPKGTGTYDTDSRDNLQLAVDLTGAAWGTDNSIVAGCQDKVAGTVGTLSEFTVVYDGLSYGSADAPVAIPDNTGVAAAAAVSFQTGGDALTITPAGTNVPAAASSGRLIAVVANVDWTAATNVPWLVITGGASGSGNGTVTYRVEANTDAASRTGAIIVAGGSLARTCTVLQAGTATGPTLGDAVEAGQWTWTTGGDADWTNQTATTHDGVDAAVSGTISHNEESWMQTTVTGPGTLTFWWRVSSETNYDFLRFFIDDVDQGGAISGTAAWQQRTVTIATGAHTIRWRYSKDVSVSTGSDCGWVDQIGWTSGGSTLVLAPAATNVPATASSGRQLTVTAANVSWTAATNVPWLAITAGASGTTNGTVTISVAANGAAAARTGLITVAGSGLARTCTVVQAGAASPSISISPSSTNVPATALSGRQVAVTAANVSWTAATNVPWLAITAGASGTTNGTVIFSVASNGTAAVRTGLITVAGSGLVRTCTVVQAAASSGFATRRINCGGGATGNWGADTGYSGGTAKTTTAAIANATNAPQVVYQSRRYAPTLTYSFPDIPDGTYTIRLHFAELYASAAGQRRFNVAIEGLTRLTNFDIYQAAGGKNRAVVKTFENVTVAGGLQIQGVASVDSAQFNGIEIESAGPPPPAIVTSTTQVTVPEEFTATFGVHLDTAPEGAITVTVVRASGDTDITVTSGASLVFTAANYAATQTVYLAAANDTDSTAGTAVIQCTASGYTAASVTATEADNDVPAFSLKVNCGGPALTGGWLSDTGGLSGGVWSTTSAVANATLAPMALYQRERSGSPLRYSLTSVPNGTYLVRLHFNEMSTAARAGTRVFNVSLEGVQRETNLDMYVAAGGSLRALVRSYSVTVTGSNGLQIEMTRVAGYPQLNGIEVLSGVGAAAPAARAGFTAAEVLAPAVVLSSADRQVPGAGWAAVDGDLETAWQASGTWGSWLCLGYAEPIQVRAVDVQFAAGSPLGVYTLASEDADNWFELEPELESGPVELNYLWFIFPADLLAPPAAVREIQVHTGPVAE